MWHYRAALLGTIALLTFAGTAETGIAQPPPDYGLAWHTVGNPGNPAAQPSARFPLLDHSVGQVDYSYRLTETEITNTQWIEFVDTYSRLHPVPEVINDPGFAGRDVYRGSDDPTNFDWHAGPQAENAAAVVGWFYAARYCNWLCNGKINAMWAFESGAYDMSTFHRQPNGTWIGQTVHSAEASYWIPSNDEWVKGMYWDPNKLGQGSGDYWFYPTSSDTLPIGGPPGTPGAQTSAGAWPSPYRYVPVASYPDASSPWGLLDGSGGAPEYLEGWVENAAFRGSQTREQLYASVDRLDATIDAVFPTAAIAGLRIASSVPEPGCLVLMCVAGGWIHQSRRRRHEQAYHWRISATNHYGLRDTIQGDDHSLS
jgi:hypothetical protein